MTQRSIFAHTNETIIIKAGGSVTIRGQEGDRLIAEASGFGGLVVERHGESEIGRARAAVGEHVLFDVHLKLPGSSQNEVIEVKIGGSGEVLVPFESNIKVYAGKDIDVQGLKGQVDAFAGLNLKIMDVYSLGNISAGGSTDVDARTMTGKDVTFSAGRDLRFHVADLTSLRLRVKDIGGYWEARIGSGEKGVYLKSGGDVTFVTDQQVEPLPPNYILGRIERPA
jgi:hypothetical protein